VFINELKKTGAFAVVSTLDLKSAHDLEMAAKRVQFARRNSWDKLVQDMLQIIMEDFRNNQKSVAAESNQHNGEKHTRSGRRFSTVNLQP